MSQPQIDQQKVNLYNPDIKDFHFFFVGDDNIKKEYILRSQEVTTLPKYVAVRAANTLAHDLVFKRGIKTNYEKEKADLLKEITFE
jgi:hypothetical protein